MCTVLSKLIKFLFLFKQNKMSGDCFQKTGNQLFVSGKIFSDNVQTNVILSSWQPVLVATMKKVTLQQFCSNQPPVNDHGGPRLENTPQ